MVLIHGAGGDHTVWGDVHARLRKRGVPVLALDLPGHGPNPSPAPQTVTERADAVEEMIASAGVGAYALAGHSLGGAVALTLACRQRQALRGFAIVSSGARLPVDPRVLKGALESFECTVENLARFLVARGAAPGLISKAAGMLADAGPQTLHADFLACATFGLQLAELQALGVPAEIVCGESDVMTPVALSEELAAALPDARLTKLPGVGHLPLLEDPSGLAGVLENLWKRAFPGEVAP
jgi:pimeloyl-ACP methyl ester carboxylesterase